LKVQGQYFIDRVRKGANPDIADATKGYDVVKTLCAVQKSMSQNGIPVVIEAK
jgi:hypothetical protein